MSGQTANTTERHYIDLSLERKEKYDISKFIKYYPEHECFDILTSHLAERLPVLSHEGVFSVQVNQYRPDLISYIVYETTALWWIIMLYNMKYDFKNILPEILLEIPSITDLDALYYNLRALEFADESS